MKKTTLTQLLLASQSPRRQDYLRQMGYAFEVLAVDIDEAQQKEEKIEDYVLRLAEEKARAGWEASDKDLPVMGADTAVYLKPRILGKPKSAGEAKGMLGFLSGNRHEVYSAVAVVNEKHCESIVLKTEVYFASLTEELVDYYIGTGEPMDKAGAYGIQGFGGAFVEKINGSYSNVVGLPLYETTRLLQAFNISPQLNKEEK